MACPITEGGHKEAISALTSTVVH